MRKGENDYKKHRNVLEIILVATCPMHQYCADSWDTKMDGVQACFSEAMILIMIVSHPQVSTFMLSVLTPTATIPVLVLSLLWVTKKASGILFPSFTLHTELMLSLPSSILITLSPCSGNSRNLPTAYWMEFECYSLIFKALPLSSFHCVHYAGLNSLDSHSGLPASVMNSITDLHE